MHYMDLKLLYLSLLQLIMQSYSLVGFCNARVRLQWTMTFSLCGQSNMLELVFGMGLPAKTIMV
jgi:hypothetical protein